MSIFGLMIHKELLYLLNDLGKRDKMRGLPREHSGSVVECMTRDPGAVGSSHTDVTALWSLSKTYLS